MSANKVRESAKARDIALDVLKHLVPLRLHERNFTKPVAGELGVLPIYVIPPKRLLKDQFNKGWRWGWCYFWVSSEDFGAIVNIFRGGKDGPAFAGFSFGRKAKKVAEMLDVASVDVDGSPIKFRPRLLRLAPLHLEAIWLNSDPDDEPEHFYSLTTGIESDQFLQVAKNRATRWNTKR